MDEKRYWNIFIYDISHKTLIDAKSLCVRFDAVDGFTRVYNGTRYLLLLEGEKYDFIYNRIRYLKEVKSGIIYIFFSHNYAKIKVDSYYSLPLEKTLTFHNVIIHKDQNCYYLNTFLEVCLNQWHINNDNKGFV